MEKIINICCKGIRFLGVLLVGYLFLQGLFTICCLQSVTEKIFYMKNNVPRQIAGILLFFLLTVFLGRKGVHIFLEKYGRYITGGMLLLITAFLVVWIMHTRLWYDGDMSQIFDGAEGMLKGDYSGWQPGGYLYMWPHQNGLALLVVFLLKYSSVGTAFHVLYGLNIIFFNVTVVSLLFSWRILYPEPASNCVQSVMLICCLPYAFLCLMMYGDVIGFGFACAGIAAMLKYTENHRTSWLAASAVCMALAVIFKQNELIVLVGLMILLVADCFKSRQQRRKKVILAMVYLVVILMGIQIPNLLVEQITGMKIQGNSKWAHVAMGLQEDPVAAPGWCNNYNADIFIENNYDKQATAMAAKDYIWDRLTEFAEEPVLAWRFFNYKLAAEWNNPTFECFHIQNARNTGMELNSLVKSTINDGGKINILLIALFDVAQSVLLFGVLMYLIAADGADWRQHLFLILFLGAFVFFAFWEAKCRYVLPFFYLLIPYSFLGYKNMVERLKIRRKGWDKMHIGIAVIGILILVIALSDGQWVQDSFKIYRDTDTYYQYIHQYNNNFIGFYF